MRMRSPSWPRIIGRFEFGPNQLDDTPGRPSSVSPSVLPRRRIRRSPLSTEVGAAIALERSGLPVTITPAAPRSGEVGAWAPARPAARPRPAPSQARRGGTWCAIECFRCRTARRRAPGQGGGGGRGVMHGGARTAAGGGDRSKAGAGPPRSRRQASGAWRPARQRVDDDGRRGRRCAEHRRSGRGRCGACRRCGRGDRVCRARLVVQPALRGVVLVPGQRIGDDLRLERDAADRVGLDRRRRARRRARQRRMGDAVQQPEALGPEQRETQPKRQQRTRARVPAGRSMPHAASLAVRPRGAAQRARMIARARPDGETGRRSGLKIRRPREGACGFDPRSGYHRAQLVRPAEGTPCPCSSPPR